MDVFDALKERVTAAGGVNLTVAVVSPSEQDAIEQTHRFVDAVPQWKGLLIVTEPGSTHLWRRDCPNKPGMFVTQAEELRQLLEDRAADPNLARNAIMVVIMHLRHLGGHPCLATLSDNGRHLRLSLVLVVDRVACIPPYLHDRMDVWLLGRQRTPHLEDLPPTFRAQVSALVDASTPWIIVVAEADGSYRVGELPPPPQKPRIPLDKLSRIAKK